MKVKDNEMHQEEFSFLNDKKELIEIISILQDRFNPADINDYRTSLLIILNSLFLREDDLTSDLKYKLYGLLDTAMARTEKYMNNEEQKIEDSKRHEPNTQELVNEIYTKILPYYMQNGIDLRRRGERKVEKEGICQ